MSSLIVSSNITLNVSRPNSGVVVYAKQYDMGSRVIDISLVNGSEVWDPPIDCEMVVMFAKPDGTKGIYDVVENYPEYSSEDTYSLGDRVIHSNSIYQCNTAISTPEAWDSEHWTYVGDITHAIEKLDTGKIRLTLAEQALSAAGNVFVEISFYESLIRSTTLSFVLAVESGIPDNGTIVSSDYFNILSSLIQGVLGSSAHPPLIDDDTKNWKLWDVGQNDYVVSDYSSLGTQGIQGPRGNSISRVELSSSFPAGQAGNTDTYSVYAENTVQPVGTFVVYNGEDGEGAPSSADPQDLGETDPGVSPSFSRSDHVHRHPIRYGTVELEASNWAEDPETENIFYLHVTEVLDNNGNAITVSENDRIDLFANYENILQLMSDGVNALYINVGENAFIEACAVGGVPSVDLVLTCNVIDVFFEP